MHTIGHNQIFDAVKYKWPYIEAEFVPATGAIITTYHYKTNNHLKHVQQEQVTNNIPNISKFCNGFTTLMGQVFPIVEVPRWHSDTPHLVGLLWTNDRPSQGPLPDYTQHSQAICIVLYCMACGGFHHTPYNTQNTETEFSSVQRRINVCI